LRKFI